MIRTWSQLSHNRQPLFLNRKRQSLLLSSGGSTETGPSEYQVGYGLTPLEVLDGKSVASHFASAKNTQPFLVQLLHQQKQSRWQRIRSREAEDQSAVTSTSLNPS